MHLSMEMRNSPIKSKCWKSKSLKQKTASYLQSQIGQKTALGSLLLFYKNGFGIAEFFFSHCLADSEKNIIKQLEVWVVNQCFNTIVMEKHYWWSAYKPAKELALMPLMELWSPPAPVSKG